MKTIYKKLLFLFLLLPCSILAQNVVNGVVVDKKTNKPVQECKKIKVHKKLEGTTVPEKK